MEFKEASISRRNLLRGAAATALLLPFGMSLASCATPGGGGGAEKPAGDAARSRARPTTYRLAKALCDRQKR